MKMYLHLLQLCIVNHRLFFSRTVYKSLFMTQESAPEEPKMHQNSWRPGLRPGPHWGSLQRSPIRPNWWKGAYRPLPKNPTSGSALRASSFGPSGLASPPQCWFCSDATATNAVAKTWAERSWLLFRATLNHISVISAHSPFRPAPLSFPLRSHALAVAPDSTCCHEIEHTVQ